MKKVVSIVLNNFKNDSRVLKENISLQNAGYEVKVIALHEAPLKEYEEIQNIFVHRVKLKSRKWSKNKAIQILKYFEFIYRVIKQYKNNDIFHCNDLNALPIGVLIKKIFNKNAKIIYDAHEYETEINGLKGIQKRLVKFLEKNLIQYADKVITVSDSIANEYKKLYAIRKPSLVLNAPLYQNIEKKDIFRDTFNIKKEQTIFLYQGGLSFGRGIEILRDAFKILWNDIISDAKDFPVIIFMGYGDLEKLIEEASKKYKNIFFHKAVSPEILLEYTSSADFGFLFYENTCLNHYYCSPNKIFEYLMAEVPIVASNLYEMKKLIESNKVGVTAKENTPKSLIETINKAIELNKQELNKNIKNIKKIYNWEEQEKVLLEVYKGLNK